MILAFLSLYDFFHMKMMEIGTRIIWKDFNFLLLYNNFIGPGKKDTYWVFWEKKLKILKRKKKYPQIDTSGIRSPLYLLTREGH